MLCCVLNSSDFKYFCDLITDFFLKQIIFLSIMCITPPPHRVPFLNVVVQAPPLSISKYGIVAMPLLLDLVNEIQCKPHLGRPLTFYKLFGIIGTLNFVN